jgi:hypothetical protein
VCSTQSISDQVCLSGMIVDPMVIVFDKIEPSLLFEIKIQLHEDVLQTFVIYINLTLLAHDVMSLDLESVNHSCQLQIVGQIMLFILFLDVMNHML